jgi:hypothetical protein
MKRIKNFEMFCLLLFVFIVSINNIVALDYYVTYDPNDATSNIQAGIDSGADRVILSYQGSGTKWISGPLSLKSNMELVLEIGVVLEAKSGAFTSLTTPFIAITGKNNVGITGYGAAIRMLINEYTNGEWRHCLSVRGGSNITIKGVRFDKGGGDGIYLGTYGGYCDTVLIQDVTCDGNARNGISIISAKNVTIDNCKLYNSGVYNPSGLAQYGPWDGIDFEPNYSEELLQNINITNCTFNNNKHSGIHFSLQNFTLSTLPVSIIVSDCYITSSDYGIYVYPALNPGTGYIDIEDCTIENTDVNGLKFLDWHHDSIDIDITNCTLINPTESTSKGAIELSANTNISYTTGNFDLSNIYVYRCKSPYILALEGASQNYGIEDVVATIYTEQPDSNILYNNYYYNINASIYRLVVEFNTAFSSYADNIGGTDSELFLTSPDTQVYTGDYNGDGKTDMFIKGYGTYRGLYVANLNGDGFYRPFMANGTGVVGGIDAWVCEPTAKVYPGDYNGDGKTDLFVKGYGTYRGLYLANTTGTGFNCVFSSDLDSVGGTDSEPFLTDADANVYVGDYNGDGKSDLFVKGYNTYRALYLMNSSGTGFNRAFLGYTNDEGGIDVEPFLTSPDAQVYTGDYNGDGKTDLFVKGYGTYRILYLANSSGTGFTRPFMGDYDGVGGTDSEPFLTSSDAKIFAGDYNGDGKTDLFVKGYNTYRTLYLANSSGNGFNRAFLGYTADAGGIDVEPFFTSSDAKVYTGDYNGDGKTDLFVKGYGTYRALYLANASGTGFTCVFAGDSDGIGGTDSEALLTNSDANVYVGDYNGDGRTDLFIKGYQTYRTLYLSGGTYQ